MAAIQHACARGGGTMSPDDWGNLANLWRTGWPTARLAKHFGIDESRVVLRLKPLMDERAGCAAAFDGEMLEAPKAAPADYARAPEVEQSEQRAQDEAHWRAALAAGGFVAWTEGKPKRPRLNPPLSRPLIAPAMAGRGVGLGVRS